MTAPRIWIPGGKPILIKQLQTGSPTSSFDCGVCATLVNLQRASHQSIHPRTKKVQKNWIAYLRRTMSHGATWPATTLQNHEQAVESAAVASRFHQLGQPRPHGQYQNMTHGEVIKALKNGKSVDIAIDYGEINRLMPRLSGSRTFFGGHGIALVGYAFADGWAWSLAYDSLWDGRRPGIPKGPQVVRVRRYLRAAETWGIPQAGEGHAKGLIISN